MPPFQYVPVDIPLARGLDNRSDAKVMEPTHLVDLRNAVFDKRGCLTKRQGFASLTLDVLGSSTNISEGKALFRQGKSLLKAAHSKLYQYSTADTVWIDRGAYVGWETSEDPVLGNTGDFAGTSPRTTMAEINGVRVTAWKQSYPTGTAGIYYMVEDSTTNTVVKAPTLLSSTTGTGVWVINPSGSNNILVFYVTSADSKLSCFKIDTTALETSLTSPTITQSSTADFSTTSSTIDIARSGSQVVFAAINTPVDSTPFDLRVGFVSAAGVFGNTAAIRAEDVLAGAVAVFANSTGSSNVALFKGNTGSRLAYTMFNASATETAQGNVNDSAVGYVACSGIWASDDSTWTAVWQGNTNSGTSADNFLIRTATHNSAGVQTVVPATKLRCTTLAGRPFRFQSAEYYHVVPTQSYAINNVIDNDVALNLLCMAMTDHKPVGLQLRAQMYYMPAGHTLIQPQVYESSGENWVQFSAPTNNGRIKRVKYAASVSETKLSYGAYSRANLGERAYLGGPMTWEFDGVELRENGFCVFPSMASSADWVTQGTSGSLTQLATYRYRIYYEYDDYFGNRVQSAFPFDFEVTLTGSNDDVSIVVPTLHWTRRAAANVQIAVYRTEAFGAIFYRIDEVANDTTANSVTVQDTLSDANLRNNELDYQTQGELDNLPFPACVAMCAGQERVFGIDGSDRKHVVFSKLRDGDGGLEWNDGLYIEFPEELTALGVLGNQVYGFSKSAVYAVSGEGPDNTGTVGAFSAPAKITHNLGCYNQRALGETPLGLVFVGDRGIWLVSGEGVRYISDNLSNDSAHGDDLVGQPFASIVCIPGSSRVRFSPYFYSSSGRHLEWDYEFNQWSTHVYPHHDVADAVSVEGYYYHLRGSTGVAYKHSSLTYTDDGTAITMYLETAHIRPSGSAIANSKATHGYLLGNDIEDGHSLTIQVARDNEDWVTVDTPACSEFPLIRFRLPFVSFKTIRFKITEVADGSPGEGCEIAALGLELGVEGTAGGRLVTT